MAENKHVTIHWFKKGLRLHDNPALLHAVSTSKVCFKFIIYLFKIFCVSVVFFTVKFCFFKIHVTQTSLRFVLFSLNLHHSIKFVIFF